MEDYFKTWKIKANEGKSVQIRESYKIQFRTKVQEVNYAFLQLDQHLPWKTQLLIKGNQGNLE